MHHMGPWQRGIKKKRADMVSTSSTLSYLSACRSYTPAKGYDGIDYICAVDYDRHIEAEVQSRREQNTRKVTSSGATVL